MFNLIILNEKEKILDSIRRLVKYSSVSDLKTKELNAPFGASIRSCMNEFIEIATSLGFKVEDHEGYAISAQLGDFKQHLGILGHLDVVGINAPDLWLSDPYEMSIRDGVMYGRGVNDDKGPLIAALYAAKIVYELNPNLKRSIRVIAGGAEETTWECMDYYFKHNPQPELGFSPDGNFPVVNGEMGILQLGLKFKNKSNLNFKSEPETNYLCYSLDVDGKEYRGDKHLSRNPQRGKNAIFEFMKSRDYSAKFKASDLYKFMDDYLLDDIECYHLGLNTKHEEMLPLRVCAMSLNSAEKDVLNLDFRYPINISSNTILSKIESLSKEYNYDVVVLREMKPLYVNKDSELIHSLKKAYKSVMHESADALTKGGASYARVLDCGVAFGATFEGEDPRPHMENENMSVASLLKACEIYCHAIWDLTTNGMPD